MSDQQSYEEAMAQQKANCPFCKIVKGDIPSTKVYEDKEVLAIMDINPAVKGHILLLPKEHYPILPVVPPNVQNHMFAVVRDLSRALKKSQATTSTSVFIANGGAAGQQSPHFMLHLFARNPSDALSDVFKLKPTTDETKLQQHAQTAPSLQHNLNIALGKIPKPKGFAKASNEPHNEIKQMGEKTNQETKQPASNIQAPPTSTVPDDQKKKLAQYIEEHDDFRDTLIASAHEAKLMIETNPTLQALTKGVDIDALHLRLKDAYAQIAKEETNDNNIQ